MRQALGILDTGLSRCGPLEKATLERPIPGHAQPHWLEHGAAYLEPSSDAARRAKRASLASPTLGSVLKQPLNKDRLARCDTDKAVQRSIRHRLSQRLPRT